MTNSPKLDFYRTEKHVSCGTMEEAQIITVKFRKTGGVVFANGHGEFIIATNFLAIKNLITRIWEHNT